MNLRRDEWEVGEILHAGEGPVRSWAKIACVRPQLAEEIAQYHAENLLRNEPDEDGCCCFVGVKISATDWLAFRVERQLHWRYDVRVLEEKQ